MVKLVKMLKLHLNQLDADRVFLYADLDEDILIEPTPEMDITNGYCLNLQKSLVREFVIKFGFKNCAGQLLVC